MQPMKSHTGEVTHTIILHIYTGDSSSFTFYEDDGLTYDYQKGSYALRKISHDHQTRRVSISAVDGKFTSPAKRFKMVFHGLDEYTNRVIVNGNELTLNRDINMSFVALEKFDPIHDPEPAPQQNVHIVDFEYIKEEIVVQF